MTIQVLNWCSDEQLNCGTSIPALAVLCVPSSIVANPTPINETGIVIANITAVRPSTCADPCGPCKWIYTFQYDDAGLVPGYLLSDKYILGVICDSCLLNFIITYVALVPPGQVCVESSETLELFVNEGTGCVGGRVIISEDPNNCLQAISDGLFVPCPPDEFIQSVSDSNNVALNVTANNLTAGVKISADANNAVEDHADGIYVPQVSGLGLAVNDTATVDLTLAAGPTLSADVKISGDIGNEIVAHADGIYAPAVCATDSDTIDFFIDGAGCVSGNVIASSDPGNILTTGVNGVYVPPDFIQTVSDTATVDLAVVGSDLSGAVKVSADVGNILVAHGDGLYVPTPAGDFIQSISDTTSIDLTVALNNLSGVVKVSGNPGNLISIQADGIYTTPVVSDTSTIDLTVTAGTISGAVKVSADSFNLVEAHSDGLWVPATDGWLPFNAALTYASANSFTLVGDWTDRLSVGTKIKVTDAATIKYFYVSALVFGGVTTSVSIYAGDDFTLSGGAISNAFFSLVANPANFQHYFNYSPSYPVTVVTFTQTAKNHAKFAMEGRTVILSVNVTGTTSGVNGNQINVGLPIAVSAGITTGVGIAVETGPGSNKSGHAFLAGSTANCYVYDASNWGLGTDRQIVIDTTYEA